MGIGRGSEDFLDTNFCKGTDRRHGRDGTKMSEGHSTCID